MKISKSLLTVPIVLGSLLLGTMPAIADSTPTIATVIHDGSHNIVTTVQVGTQVHDSVTVASSTDASASSTPLGTATFTVYPNTTCSGSGTVQAGVPLVNGVAESGTSTVPNTGLSYSVVYNGQSTMYASTTAPCETLAVTASSTSISTALSTTSAPAGISVYDTATLAGVTANAGGTVAYTAFTNNTCNAGAMNAGTMQVTNASVPNSNALQFNTAGTYYWQAVYSGDINNIAATSSCQNEVLTVIATTTATTTPTPGAGSISGTVYNDLNRSGSKDAGEPLLSGWTINLYSGTGWSGPTNKAPIMTMVSDANGHYSFGSLADGTYSIEEINQASLNQYTADYDSVVISNGAILQNYDFGNVSGNPYDNNGNQGNGHNKDKGDHKKDKGDDHSKDNSGNGRGSRGGRGGR